MKKLFTYSWVASMILSVTSVTANHFGDKLQFSARLNGAQEVPATSVNAVGVGSFMLNGTQDQIEVNATFTGLTGSITGVHIHSGAPGENGGVVIDLMQMLAVNKLSGSIAVTSAQLAEFVKGGYYLNVHTAANPNGEIRGQIILETDMGFEVMLSAAQQVPETFSSGYGLGTVVISKAGHKMKFEIKVQNLNATMEGAHFHVGAPGVNGPVVIDLTPYIVGNNISGEINYAALPASVQMQLMAGDLYLNIHTAVFPDGEIRGQVRKPRTLGFDARINAAQEVPPSTSFATGIATLFLSDAMDTLYYRVITENLSGPITGAHIHAGALGENGAVVIPLDEVAGNGIMGSVSLSSMPATLISAMLKGELYVNIHTDANPDGEIRGQIYRHAREGFGFDLCGSQEVPAVNTNGYGSGVVSYDRDRSNLHYMIVTDNLSGLSDGAHIHSAAAGANGAVIIDLSDALQNNATFGYDTMLTTAIAADIKAGLTYVNVHTDANGNGEVRGQIDEVSECGMPTASGEITFAIFNLYPNPATSDLTLATGDENIDLITVTDVSGRTVMSIIPAKAQTVNIQVEQIPAGIYFLRVTGDTGTASYRFVKN